MNEGIRVTRTVSVAALIFMASSCGGDTSEPAQSENTPAARASAECVDRAGDGKGGDLTRVLLTEGGDNLTVTFETEEPIPTSGTALFSVDAWSQDGNTGYQLGLKYDSGEEIAHFVFDHVEVSQRNLDAEVSTDGTATTATFPMSEIEALGETFQWSATYNVAGDDVDQCPNPGGDTMDPKTEKFPGK